VQGEKHWLPLKQFYHSLLVVRSLRQASLPRRASGRFPDSLSYPDKSGYMLPDQAHRSGHDALGNMPLSLPAADFDNLVLALSWSNSSHKFVLHEPPSFRADQFDCASLQL